MPGQQLHQQVLGVRIRTQDMPGLLAGLSQRVRQRLLTPVYLANVHMLMEARQSAAFAKVLAATDYVLADGRPLCWWLRGVYGQHCEQIRGFDLMTALLQQASLQQWRVGLYGGQDAEQLAALADMLRRQWPQLQLVFLHAPPFETPASSDPAVLARLAAAQLDMLLVSLGCPKQELWIAANSSRLPPLQVGVGAAFDYLSGRLKQAPRWLQRLGLEWFFRWLQQPLRLSGRYLRHNPVFLWQLIKACWQAQRR